MRVKYLIKYINNVYEVFEHFAGTLVTPEGRQPAIRFYHESVCKKLIGLCLPDPIFSVQQ